MADENPVFRDRIDSRVKCDGCKDGGGREKEIKVVGGGDNQRFPLIRGKWHS